MKNKKGNVAVIAIIIVVVAITAGVIGWLLSNRNQTPVQQAAVTQPAPVKSVTQTPATQPVAVAQPTANLQTYTNAKVGFQFSYDASSSFNASKMKINTSTLGSNDGKEQIQQIDLYLPTSDKNYVSFPPQITDPTKKDVADWQDGTYIIGKVFKFQKANLSNYLAECDKDVNAYQFCDPITKSQQNYSSDGKYAFYYIGTGILYANEKDTSLKDGTIIHAYPSDGIKPDTVSSFKAL